MADWNGDGHDDWWDDYFLYAMLSNLNDDTDTSDGCGCFGCLSWVFHRLRRVFVDRKIARLTDAQAMRFTFRSDARPL